VLFRSVVLANPQTLDSGGRSTNKIWIPGQYSFRVDDLNGIQEIQDLDAGENPDTGTTSLSTVQGTNTITAEATPGITAYVNNEIYIFTAAGANTGAVTLNIDSVGAKAIKRNHDQALLKNQFEQNQIVQVIFNSTDDVFEWTNQNLKVIHTTKASDIASAATVDLTNLAGNTATVTGSTGPITSFGSPPAGDLFYLTFTGTPGITHNGTSLLIPGQENITIIAGDQVRVESLGSGNNQIQISRGYGPGRLIQIVDTIVTAATSNASNIPYDDTIPSNVEGVQVMSLAITPQKIGSRLKVDVIIAAAASSIASSVMTSSLFQDSGSAAIAASSVQLPNAADNTVSLSYTFLIDTVSKTTTTFKVFLGASSGTMTFNGSGAARKLGGVLASSIIITEYSKSP